MSQNTNIRRLEILQLQPCVPIMTPIFTYLISNVFVVFAKKAHNCLFLINRQYHTHLCYINFRVYKKITSCSMNALRTLPEHKKCIECEISDVLITSNEFIN